MQYVQITVEGKVQGVFFRKHAQQVAIKLRLNGFVRNSRDGSVYIVACGPDENVQQLVVWCHSGPKEAAVSAVRVSNIEPRAYHQFEIRSTE